MSKEKNIEIGKIDLEKEHTFYPIKELPVKSTDMVKLMALEITNILREDLLCHLALSHWKKIGCVVLYEKETLINARMDYLAIACGISMGYKKQQETREQIRESMESLILQGVFKEEIEGQKKWLIPLKPLLECASPLAKEPKISWCLNVQLLRYQYQYFFILSANKKNQKLSRGIIIHIFEYPLSFFIPISPTPLNFPRLKYQLLKELQAL